MNLNFGWGYVKDYFYNRKSPRVQNCGNPLNENSYKHQIK